MTRPYRDSLISIPTKIKLVVDFYPDIPVVVADDTPDPDFQSINITQFPNARQYKMPGHSGWFAGRALAISQVETEYFIWFDDDFQEGILTVSQRFSHFRSTSGPFPVYFRSISGPLSVKLLLKITAETKLELLFNIIEDLNYDVVSGKVGFDDHVTNFQQKTRFYVERNKDGFCYDRRPAPYHVKIPEYPDCQIADIVTNYFIARTTSAGTIRMDPQFRERAHREWFLDGVGFLRIAKEGFICSQQGLQAAGKLLVIFWFLKCSRHNCGIIETQ